MKRAALFTVIVLLGIIIFHIGINFLWISQEAAPPMWDQAMNALHSREFYKVLQKPNIAAFFNVYLNIDRERAPLLFLLGGLFFIPFGFSIKVAAMTNFIYVVMLVLGTYGIGKKLWGQGVGLLSAFIVSSFPILAGLSREFLSDYALCAFVVVSVYCLLKTGYFQNRWASIFLGIFCGLGMLAKITFPLFFAVPFFYFLFIAFIRHPEKRKAILINLFFFAGVVLLISGLWYVRNFNQWFSYLVSASYGENIQKYWKANYWNLKELYHHSYVFMNDEASWFFFWGLVLVPIYLFLQMCAKKLLKWQERCFKFDTGIFCMVLWFAVPFLIVASSRNRDPRMSICCLVPLGIILSAGVMSIALRWLRRGLVLGIVIIGLIQLIKSSFGFSYPPIIDTKGRVAFFFFNDTYAYCGPPQRNTWQMQDILLYIHQMESAGVSSPTPEKVCVGFIPDIPRFQTCAIGYYLAALKLPYSFMKVAEELNDKYGTEKCKYIITKTGDITIYSPWAVKYNQEAMDILENSGEFEKVEKTFPLPDGSSALIYKKITRGL